MDITSGLTFLAKLLLEVLVLEYNSAKALLEVLKMNSKTS